MLHIILTINTSYFHEEYYLVDVYNWDIMFSVRWELNFMSYVMLPAVLPIGKHMWHMFCVLKFLFFLYFNLLLRQRTSEQWLAYH
jgi:hypothetical protein